MLPNQTLEKLRALRLNGMVEALEEQRRQSAITELAHWQQQGYALIVPQILDKKLDLESIR